MSALAGHNFIATGTIAPFRFVVLDTTSANLFSVLQANGNQGTIIGISQPGTHDAPGTSGAGTDAADSGETLTVFGPGDVCLLELGTGGVTAGDFVAPDTNGKGVTVTAAATVQYIGAKALETGVAGDRVRVVVVLGGITAT